MVPDIVCIWESFYLAQCGVAQSKQRRFVAIGAVKLIFENNGQGHAGAVATECGFCLAVSGTGFVGKYGCVTERASRLTRDHPLENCQKTS